jgi:hypothetical protein
MVIEVVVWLSCGWSDCLAVVAVGAVVVAVVAVVAVGVGVGVGISLLIKWPL